VKSVRGFKFVFSRNEGREIWVERVEWVGGGRSYCCQQKLRSSCKQKENGRIRVEMAIVEADE
jgi:hypothetical protein